MAKIVLDVDDKNISTVMTILNNLKGGLIKSIDKNRPKGPQPVTNTNKYLSTNEYKNRLKGK